MKYFAIPVFLLATILALPADTIVLKDGTKYEGTILSENDTSYQMQVQITASIKDIKQIPKENVASATRSSPDDDAFKPISEILPVPDRQTVTRYDELIKGQVQPFLKAYPSTKHKAKAMEILKTLEQERARVAAGDLKFEGKWISSAERLANLYEIDARIAWGEMESAAEAGNFKEALRKFETIKRDYAATSYYEKAVEMARKVLRSYAPVVAATMGRVDIEINNRKSELQRLSASQRAAALEEIKKQDAAYLALVEREKSELKTRWLTLDPYHKGPTQIVQSNINSTLAELEKIDFSTLTDTGPLYKKAWAAVSQGDEAEAKNLLGELKTAGLPAQYIEKLETRLADAEKARLAAEAEAKAAAEAEQKALAEAATEKMAVEAAEEKQAAEEKAEEAAEQKATAEKAAAETPSRSSGIKIILIVVMVAVLLVALGAMLLGKKKGTS